MPLTTAEIRALGAALAVPAGLRARGRAMLDPLFDTGVPASKLAGIGMVDLVLGGSCRRGKCSQHQQVDWRTIGMGDGRGRRRNEKPFATVATPVGEDQLFLARNGRLITHKSVHRFPKRPEQRSGVERAHPHPFRHSTGAAPLLCGDSESVLQQIPGHASREMA